MLRNKEIWVFKIFFLKNWDQNEAKFKKGATDHKLRAMLKRAKSDCVELERGIVWLFAS